MGSRPEPLPVFVPLGLPDVTLPKRESMTILSEEQSKALGLFGHNLPSSGICGCNPVSSGALNQVLHGHTKYLQAGRESEVGVSKGVRSS